MLASKQELLKHAYSAKERGGDLSFIDLIKLISVEFKDQELALKELLELDPFFILKNFPESIEIKEYILNKFSVEDLVNYAKNAYENYDYILAEKIAFVGLTKSPNNDELLKILMKCPINAFSNSELLLEQQIQDYELKPTVKVLFNIIKISHNLRNYELLEKYLNHYYKFIDEQIKNEQVKLANILLVKLWKNGIYYKDEKTLYLMAKVKVLLKKPETALQYIDYILAGNQCNIKAINAKISILNHFNWYQALFDFYNIILNSSLSYEIKEKYILQIIEIKNDIDESRVHKRNVFNFIRDVEKVNKEIFKEEVVQESSNKEKANVEVAVEKPSEKKKPAKRKKRKTNAKTYLNNNNNNNKVESKESTYRDVVAKNSNKKQKAILNSEWLTVEYRKPKHKKKGRAISNAKK